MLRPMVKIPWSTSVAFSLKAATRKCMRGEAKRRARAVTGTLRVLFAPWSKETWKETKPRKAIAGHLGE